MISLEDECRDGFCVDKKNEKKTMGNRTQHVGLPKNDL